MIGIAVAVLVLGYWIWLNVRSKSDLSHNPLLLMGLVSVALVPFVLPKMHDRYFYPADVFSLLAAFYMPELWFVPILYQFVSMLAYTVFLFNAPPLATEIAAILNTLTVIFLVWKQSQTLISSSQTLPKESSA
jgi:Gpi18-like mannosyltransferase